MLCDYPEIEIDRKREYWGSRQLSDFETALLLRIKGAFLHLAFVKGEALYFCGGRKCSARAAERLIKYHYVIPRDRGLFPGSTAQTWVVNPKFREPTRRARASRPTLNPHPP